ncbi:Suppressor of fused homolog [Eumeta japonica]|uniref:Suppressor of fused homolog n=1 Tax=Eumeta variegata TaxID=151549 RepID=A0A4C1VCS4_EUMVA|nr:Suppressor of fused homolog [Eumeta japonica]
MTRCGGVYLVTDPLRRRSARALRTARNARGVRPEDVEPAQLAGVSARVRWLPYDLPSEYQSQSIQHSLPHALQEQIRTALQKGLNEMASSGSNSRSGGKGGSVTHMSVDSAPPSIRTSTDSIGRQCASGSFEMSSLERALPREAYAGADLSPSEGVSDKEEEIVHLCGVHLQLNPEGASLLPLVLLGRVAHSRHFTWRDAGGCHAVTLVGERVGGAFVTPKKPYAAKRGWLQMLIPTKVAVEMAERASSLANLADTDSESDTDDEDSAGVKKEKGFAGRPPSAPHSLHWPELNIRLSVMPDHYFY